MKKLLYTIALAGGVTFMPAVQGMDISEEENQLIERSQARIAQIRHEKKVRREKLEAELCTFDCQKAVNVLEAKRNEYDKIKEAFYRSNAFQNSINLQQFRADHPEYVQFEREYQLFYSPGVNQDLSFGIAVLKKAGVNKRTQVEELTENEMDTLMDESGLLYSTVDAIKYAASLKNNQ